MNDMKKTRILSACLIAFLGMAISPASQAQEKAPEKQSPATSGACSADSSTPPTAFRAQVVLTEYEGTNKLSSLPYTIPVATSMYEPRSLGSLRVGIRVPVLSSSKTGEATIQYIDIGSNIDVRVKRADADRYTMELTIDRSSLYVRERNKEGEATAGKEWAPGDPVPSTQPLVHEFRGVVSLLVRDGRPGEATVATDPMTGRVLKVEVLLSVLK
jgi:hypothetical protein